MVYVAECDFCRFSGLKLVVQKTIGVAKTRVAGEGLEGEGQGYFFGF